MEDALGKLNFIYTCLISALAGGLLHALVFPHGTVPVVGASGAIAGIMGAYVVLFPKVKVWLVLFFVRFKVAVRWYIGIWMGLQVLNAFMGVPGIAWFGHIGGFVAGMATASVLRRREVVRKRQ